MVHLGVHQDFHEGVAAFSIVRGTECKIRN